MEDIPYIPLFALPCHNSLTFSSTRVFNTKVCWSCTHICCNLKKKKPCNHWINYFKAFIFTLRPPGCQGIGEAIVIFQNPPPPLKVGAGRRRSRRRGRRRQCSFNPSKTPKIITRSIFIRFGHMMHQNGLKFNAELESAISLCNFHFHNISISRSCSARPCKGRTQTWRYPPPQQHRSHRSSPSRAPHHGGWGVHLGVQEGTGERAVGLDSRAKWHFRFNFLSRQTQSSGARRVDSTRVGTFYSAKARTKNANNLVNFGPIWTIRSWNFVWISNLASDLNSAQNFRLIRHQ